MVRILGHFIFYLPICQRGIERPLALMAHPTLPQHSKWKLPVSGWLYSVAGRCLKLLKSTSQHHHHHHCTPACGCLHGEYTDPQRESTTLCLLTDWPGGDMADPDVTNSVRAGGCGRCPDDLDLRQAGVTAWRQRSQ